MSLKQKIEKLKNDSEFKKILTNINWLFLDKGIQMGVAFFVSILVIRYLGPEQYGLLSYAVAFVAFFGIFSKLGLDGIVVRELVNNKFETKKLLGTVFYLKLVGGLLAVVLATIISFFLQDNLWVVCMTAMVSVSLIFQSTDVIDYWFQSKVISKPIAYSRSFASVTSAIVKVWLISIGATLGLFAIMISIEAFLVAIGFVVAYYKNKDNIGKWEFDKSIVKSLLKDSWPLMLSSIAVIIYMKIDQIMIGDILGYEALGQYSVAVQLSEMWYFIPVIVATSVFPAIIKAKEHSKELYYARLQRLYDIMVWMAIAIALPIAFLADRIINLLYGVEYAQAAGVLIIYVWAGIFVFLGVARSKWLIAENLQKYSIFFTGIGCVLNIILNVFLIRKIGIDGAALATVISYAITAIFAPLLFRRTRCMSFMMFRSFIFFKKNENNHKI